MPDESTFESWLEWSLATTAGFRRRQVFAALCAALEDRTFRTPVVVDALQRAGRELAYWAGPRATTSLFGDVLSDPEYEKAPLLWLRLGDAKRLMDDYLGARDAFNGALNLAVREVERSEATIGIASAVKNLDGGTTQLEAALQDLDPVSRSSGGTPQVAARALFQRGNLLFSSSRWADALSAYSEAEELLDKRDWTHTSLLLDVWKGKGDIHLHRGDIEAASELLTISLDLVGARATTGVDGRAHAKLSQYAGDVWRHGMFGGAELLASAKALKLADPHDPYPDEAVFELSMPMVGDIIVKNVVAGKQQGPIDEFEALVLLRRLGIDVPRPVARVFTGGQNGFIVMEKIEGESGRTTGNFFDDNGIPEANRKEVLKDALKRIKKVAEIVRRDIGLDKPWRLKDFMITYKRNESGQLEIDTMRPIDFERVKVFDPSYYTKPQSLRHFGRRIGVCV